MIDNSVTVNIDEGYTEARLPFVCDPTLHLKSNEHLAEKIYWSQVKKLNKDPKDRDDVILAFLKLIELGFLINLDDLSDDERKAILNSPVVYIIPWRAIWNKNSLSTPCRPVFDASHPTDTGYSLNDTLAKGRNNMNFLLQIFLRWMVQRCGFHTDIKKMYNSVKLAKEHWCYQLCLFHPDLTPDAPPFIFAIGTLIYGVKSSGNQAERAVRETARLCSELYPRQNEIVQNDLYVDDCVSGESSLEIAHEVTDGLETVLEKGGFHLKGITFTGSAPPEHLANDDLSINVFGGKWFSVPDLMSPKIGDMNFGKKVRGKKSVTFAGVIPEKFSRSDCAARVGEIFDLNGRFAPLVAEMKLDLRDLCLKKVDWKEMVPTELVPKWHSNFDTISELRNFTYKRCVVPEDAISLDIDTIEMGDASLQLACSAIYVRFKRKNGQYSCQLVFGRTKVLPEGMSIPRGELFAAVLTATTGHVVGLALRKYIKSRVCLTDSQIALFWITNKRIPQKEWVRNRQIEIERLTPNASDVWRHVDSTHMTADIGTRRGAKLSDVSETSPWVKGPQWAQNERETFPVRSAAEIKLTQTDLKSINDETLKLDLTDTGWVNKQLTDAYQISHSFVCSGEGVLDRIGERYKFSNYVIDPNRFRFRKVVRILALVYAFLRNLKKRIGKTESVIVSNDLPPQLKCLNDKYLITTGSNEFPFQSSKGLVVEVSEHNLLCAVNYFFKKATLEVKEFSGNSYKKISVEKSGILYFTGRILPSQEFTDKLELSDACLDLSSSSFCVPLVDRYSPLAFSVINEIHWYHSDAKHSGSDTVFRYVLQIAHVLEGRSLVNLIKDDCARCRFLRKRAIEVAMGPKSDVNFCIAPPFFMCQVDMFGPFNSYSNVNKRASTKIWFVVFVCCTTGAVDLKVTEDYTTDAFILAFTRFSCKVGYPRKLLPDAGSQLVKGCSSMKVVFYDVGHRLKEFGVDYEQCPVGAHYMHGKVERKIRHVRESFSKTLQNHRLSVIQWESLGDQVANAINNLPIATRYVTRNVENIDLLTPNRLLLARNNDRCPAGPVNVSENIGKILQQHKNVYEAWFRAWLISYVPSLMFQPKWFDTDRDPKVGDVVLFLKSEKEFDKQYQYGIISDLKISRDGKIRQVEVEYQNFAENVKRKTNRGTRELVVIHPIDEIGLVRELNHMFDQV